MRKLSWIILIGILLCACTQKDRKDPVDPQTGRAIGASEISPEELKKYIDEKTDFLIIDVRRPDAFERQTIKGAINIPLEELSAGLKSIPKETALFFT